MESFSGLGGLDGNALLSYDLRTSIGPITAIPEGAFYSPRLVVQTTLGNLSFTSNLTPNMQGTFPLLWQWNRYQSR